MGTDAALLMNFGAAAVARTFAGMFPALDPDDDRAKRLLRRVYDNIDWKVVVLLAGLLPLGLADGARLLQDVAQGAAITYDQVELDEDSFVLKLRRLQDVTVW